MNDQPPAQPSDAALLAQAGSAYAALRAEIAKIIVGQDRIVEQLLTALLADGHVLIIGVPGLAKTLLVRTLAQVLQLPWRRIQFTPDMMPSDIIGTELIDVDTDGHRTLRFVKGPIFASIILADEINRTPPKTQAALLEAMQEYQVTAAGTTYPLGRPFFVVATQNPIEQEGTYPLPEAQLDRFMFALWITYPSGDEEVQIVDRTTVSDLPSVEPVLAPDALRDIQALVRRVPASPHVVQYAVSLARSTRPDKANPVDMVNRYVEWGAGPRASQYLILAAKALAALRGEPAVSAAHIREVASSVLRHRVLPNYNATGDGVTSKDIVERLLTIVPEPQYTAATRSPAGG